VYGECPVVVSLLTFVVLVRMSFVLFACGLFSVLVYSHALPKYYDLLTCGIDTLGSHP
jgi:hypothetical protein